MKFYFISLVLFTTGLPADGPRFWTTGSRSEFMGGEFENVSLLADASLCLAPGIELTTDTGEQFIWSMVAGKDGSVYLATGHEGRVLKISASGADTTTVYDALEPEVMALAVNSAGDLFIGTSPEGRVYRLAFGDTQAEVFFDPEEKYIWNILPAASGELYIAVGSKGRV